MIRCFVAISIPKTVAPQILAAQAGLPAGRPVPAENLHLTLAFLGEHPEPVVEDVHHALSEIRSPCMDVQLEGLDAFGNGRVRLVCIRAVLSENLARLNASVKQAARLAGLNLPREKYVPHVTIARCGSKGASGEDALKLRDFAARKAGFRASFRAESFVLVRSYLGQSGPSYEDLAEYPLTWLQTS
ncbi:RNA 2',3'-cyclic phosphodiesterase [Amaricoccus macauensis]|uniref:RNA 2',3'-cyclic phosphodiesterase n=1 Tax=Amaricoccus macauensis TaxID=57001 RepID=UPI003C7E9EBE